MKLAHEFGDEIVLRPRFTIALKCSKEHVIHLFERVKTDTFVIHCIDDHVFVKIPKHRQHFWSPQLDIEVTDQGANVCTLRGLFGPKPGVWTLFMFAHFMVATLFIGVGIWAYTNASLGESYLTPILVLGFLVLVWIALYAAGSLGKSAGKKEMVSLYQFMNQTLQS